MSIGSKCGIIDSRAHKIPAKFIEAPSGAIPTVLPIIISLSRAEEWALPSEARARARERVGQVARGRQEGDSGRRRTETSSEAVARLEEEEGGCFPVAPRARSALFDSRRVSAVVRLRRSSSFALERDTLSFIDHRRCDGAFPRLPELAPDPTNGWYLSSSSERPAQSIKPTTLESSLARRKFSCSNRRR